MPSVRIHHTSVVSFPSSSTPLPLSAFDGVFVSLRPTLHVFLFKSPTPSSAFPTLANSLKRSLAQTLSSFYPFGGELTYLPSSRSVAVVFPENHARVTFIEAETDIDLKGLLKAEELDMEALRLLVPDIRRDTLPAPVMAVQITQLMGGVAVGVASHHAVADGRGLFHFMDSWTAAAVGSSNGSSNPSLLMPLHDRNLVRFDGDEEFNRAVLLHFAPHLPNLDSAPESSQPHPVVRQTFVFTAAALKHLKRQYVAATDIGDQLMPSTFATLTAHGWVSFSRANGFDADDRPVFVGFFADCRPMLMSLPEDQFYVGNCVIFGTVGLKGSELAAPDGLARAISAIGEAVKKVKADPLKNKEQCITHHQWDRTFLVSGSPWFPAYEVDLGFGRPARVERACLGGKSEAYFTAGREQGSVQATVAMAAEKMPAFRQEFMVDGVNGRP